MRVFDGARKPDFGVENERYWKQRVLEDVGENTAVGSVFVSR